MGARSATAGRLGEEGRISVTKAESFFSLNQSNSQSVRMSRHFSSC